MKKARAKKRAPGEAKAPSAESGDAATGSQEDVDPFLPAARALGAAEVVPMRADLSLALQNVQNGVEAVLAERKRLEKLGETNIDELESLPRLVLGTIFADTQIEPPISKTDLKRRLARCRELRALLLKSADSLAEAGLVPREVVDKIRQGYGAIDAAKDAVALAGLFNRYAEAIAGKHPVTEAQIQEAGEVGAALLKILKRRRAPKKRPARPPLSDLRDRLWTLVVGRHESLWKAGAYLFGHAVEEKVPSLQAYRGGRPKKKQDSSGATTGTVS